MSDGRRKYLTDSANALLDRGFEQIDSHHDDVDVGSGINYTVFEYGDDTFFVRAKEYVYHNLAPFGERMVENAIDDGALLVIYFADEQAHYVADPLTVRADGSRTSGRSRRTDTRPWLEVTLDETAPLDDYLDDTTALPSPDDARPEQTLDNFARGERDE